MHENYPFAVDICPTCQFEVEYQDAKRALPALTREDGTHPREDEVRWVANKNVTAADLKGGSGAVAHRLGGVFKCPKDHTLHGKEVGEHELPVGIFERTSINVGFIGPTASTKSTLLGLTCHHLKSTEPSPFERSQLSFTLPAPSAVYDEKYSKIGGQSLSIEATPEHELPPPVTVKVDWGSAYESANLILFDSGGQNFDGKARANAVKFTPALYTAQHLVLCVPPESLSSLKTKRSEHISDSTEVAIPDGTTPVKPQELLKNGIDFLIAAQLQRRSSMSHDAQLVDLPWLSIVVTKSDTILPSEWSDELRDRDSRYRTSRHNVSYKTLDVEWNRILDESNMIRRWLESKGINTFDQLEYNARHKPNSDVCANKRPLFQGISYHAITLRSGGTNDNRLYDPRAEHDRLLDPILISILMAERQRRIVEPLVFNTAGQ